MDAETAGPRAAGRRAHRRSMVEEAARRLGTRGLDAVRGLLNVAAVQRGTDDGGHPVPRASAYRLFGGDDGTATDGLVRAAADHVHERSWHFGDQVGSGLDGPTLAAYAELDDEGRAFEALRVGLRADLRRQIDDPWLAASSLLQAGALSAIRSGAADDGLGAEVLASRRAVQRRHEERCVEIFVQLAAARGERPRPGLDVRAFSALCSAFSEGVALRLAVDPDAFDLDLAAEVLARVHHALCVAGGRRDPRRPLEGPSVASFDAVVAEATRRYGAGAERVEVHVAAAAARVEGEEAAAWFPTDADLADSVVAAAVLPEGDDDGTTPTVGELDAMLVRLGRAAATVPGAVTLVGASTATLATTTLGTVERAARRLVRAVLPGAPAADTAHDLVTAALAGPPGRRTVLPVLRLLGLPVEAG